MGGGTLLCTSFHLSGNQVQQVATSVFFSFSPFLCLAASWTGVDKNIRTICAEQRVFTKYWRLTWEVLEGHLEVLDAHMALESHNGALGVPHRS